MGATLGACAGGAGSTSFLEVGVGAGCALNDKKLEAVFLQQPHGSVTGSFGDWKQRLMDEKADAASIHERCDADALAAFTAIKTASDALNAQEIATATGKAAQETTAVNNQEIADNAAYDARWSAVEVPYLAAKQADATAEADRDRTASIQAAAEQLQATSVAI